VTDSRIRTSIIGVIALALFSALFARLWYLQVAATTEYAAAAERNAVRSITEPPIRGRILDAKGRVLARNRIANVITIDRKTSKADQEGDVARLATLLQVPEVTLHKKLDDPRVSPYSPVPVAIDVPYNILSYVSEHREQFPGVKAEPIAIRQYVNGSTAAHVLGYVGEINEEEMNAQPPSADYALGDDIGKAGVEQTYESELRGRPGVQQVEIDSTGKVLRTLHTTPPTAGHDVQLTLDVDVQKVAEQALAEGIASAQQVQDKTNKEKFEKFKAPGGAVVVLDATDGSVVAMASNPTYNPNSFADGIPTSTWKLLNDPAGHYPLIDRAVVGQYAPGSTFKLVTAIAGLQSGEITPTQTIEDKGKYVNPTDKREFRNDNSAVYGRVDLPHALTVSSDVFFYTIGGDLYYRDRHGLPGGDQIQKSARELGFGKTTGIALPNEATGRVPDAAWKQKVHEQNPAAFPYPDWLPGDNILSAVGQGDVLATPLQLANAYATLANGGTVYQPRLASGVLNPDGTKVRDLPPNKAAIAAIPARDTLLAGFQGVVADRKGTAAGVFAGFPEGMVGGKTGTAQVQGKQNTSLFVGMTPAMSPKYVVVAVIEESGYGAAVAAPVVRAVMQQLNGMPVTPVVVAPAPDGN
jgi:penicillin-binding protein 2